MFDNENAKNVFWSGLSPAREISFSGVSPFPLREPGRKRHSGHAHIVDQGPSKGPSFRRPPAPNPFSRAPHPHKELGRPALPSTYAALSGNPTLVNLPESCTTCPLARWARSRLTASLYGHNLASRNVFYIDFRPCISVFAIVTFCSLVHRSFPRPGGLDLRWEEC